MKTDVLILGAGAAGLACARELSRHALSSVVIEARDRIGGRILTIHDPLSNEPLEMGAEFVHGIPPEILNHLADFELPFYDVLDEHLFLRGRRLADMPDFFDTIATMMKKLRTRQQNDRSVAAFIKAHSFSKAHRDLFASFVEGFHSADLGLIGEHGLASTEESQESDLNGVESFRIPSGYHDFISRFVSTRADHSELNLGTRVQNIHWQPDKVVVQTCNTKTGQVERYRARRLVCTFPIGVLKSDLIQWDPRPPELDRALEGVEMGHALRIVFKFKSRFWESLSKKPIGYLHAGPAERFPTWWTFAPRRSPYLVAWQGGPKAEEMSHWSRRELTTTALQTLAKITKRDRRFLRQQLTGMYYHNWSHDPYSRGSYSYVTVDGMRKWMRLQRPIQNTLFFAGEGWAEGAGRGTVHGAIQSGEKIANLIVRSEKPKRGAKSSQMRRNTR